MIDLFELRIYNFTIYTKNCNSFSIRRDHDKTVLVIKHDDSVCTSDDSTNVNLYGFVHFYVDESKSQQEIFVYDRDRIPGGISIEINSDETLFIFKKPIIKESFCTWVKTIFRINK